MDRWSVILIALTVATAALVVWQILEARHAAAVQNNIALSNSLLGDARNIFYERKQEAIKELGNEIEQTISSLKKLYAPNGVTQYKYFEGIHGIKAMWLEANEHMVATEIIDIY